MVRMFPSGRFVWTQGKGKIIVASWFQVSNLFGCCLRMLAHNHTRMAKKALIVVLTAASILCAFEPVSMLGATDQSWLPMERGFLVVIFVALVVATLLLWARVRWALVPAISTNVVFGTYLAWLITGTIRNQNYSGTAVLVFLVCMGLCPFLAALAAAVWGREFCERRTNVI